MKYSLLLGLFLGMVACQSKMTETEILKIGLPGQKTVARYIKDTGFDMSRVALSTTEINVPNLALVQVNLYEKDTLQRKLWEHPSWVKAGPMGPLTSDDVGNAYTAPIPQINTLNRNLKVVNQIHNVDQNTGELKLFLQLPIPDSTNNSTPFGIIGLYFDSHGQKLYASTVAASTRDKENGKIFVIDTKTKTIVDQIENVDAFGLFVSGVTGQKRLYYGSARKSDLFSIELNKEGEFVGDSKLETSLNNLGPRGNDKARRIRTDNQGNMFIYGLDFNYNLAAQTIKPESIYRYAYNFEEKKWSFIQIIK
jgi:hypothetical protein